MAKIYNGPLLEGRKDQSNLRTREANPRTLTDSMLAGSHLHVA